MLTRRGFFSFITGAAALSVVPFELAREYTAKIRTGWRAGIEVGDLIIITSIYGTTTTRYRIVSLEGPVATVEEV